MKKLIILIVASTIGTFIYAQRATNFQATTITGNDSRNVGSSRIDVTRETNNSNSNNNTWTNDNTSNNNWSSSNNSNTTNNNTLNNNNNYNNGYYSNSYNNSNSYSNNYTTQNNQSTYTAKEEGYGTNIVTADKVKSEKSNPYNTTDMLNNYRNTTPIERLFTKHQKPSQIFIVNAQTQNTLTGTDGTIIKIQPNSFLTKNGEIVTGDVEFELKEVYQKSDMVLSNAHTVCNDLPLESGGEMFLGASKNSEPLVLATDKPIIIEMPASENDEMQLFYGKPDRNTVNWNLANSNTVSPVRNPNSSTGSSYNFNVSSMNWINCDKFIRNNGPSTKINVHVPRQFDTTNTSVFIVFSGQNTVTKFDNYNLYDNLTNDPNPSVFDTRWYSVPVGADVTIVAISEIDGQYYSSMQRTKIQKDHQQELTFEPTTMDEFKKQMTVLP